MIDGEKNSNGQGVKFENNLIEVIHFTITVIPQ